MTRRNKSQYATVYLVRHAQAKGNRDSILLGQLESPLTKKGIGQAKILSQKLRNVHFDAVYSSDLSRAEQTARIFALQRKLSVIKTKLLRERYLGPLEGKKSTTVEGSKELLARFATFTNKEKMEYKFDSQMESAKEAASRLAVFFKKIAPTSAGKTILAVTHAATMGSFLVHLGHIDYKGLFASDSLVNTGYAKIRTNGKKFFFE